MLQRLSPFKKTPIEPPPRLPYSHVDLYYWSPENGSVNFGDWLSDIVVRKILTSRHLTLDDQVEKQERLLAVGSILHYANSGDHIWGTGWNGKIPEKYFTARDLTVHAVRGPLTRHFLQGYDIDVPEIYGDPALLIPHIFKDRFRVTGERDYVVVPNLHDLSLVQNEPNVVSPLWSWNVVIKRIVEAKLVLASSLHGLIIAEAYGIPARYVRLSPTEDLFKYRDYYLGTGRTEAEFIFANSIEEGIAMGGAPTMRYDHRPLLDAFPFSLWR